MVWRAPWVRSRLRLAAFAGWDALCITAIYSGLYRIRIDRLDVVTGGSIGFTVLWSFFSYILGRYSSRSGESKDIYRHAAADLVTTLVLGSVIGMAFIAHAWLLGIDDAGTRYRGFLGPLVVLIAMVSTSSNTVARISERRHVSWTVILKDEEMSCVQKALNQLEPGLDVNLCNGRQFLKVQSREIEPTELVLSPNALESKELGERLVEYKSRGRRIRELGDWLESQLHFVPPELVNDQWLLTSSGFMIQPGRNSWRVKRLGDILGAAVVLVVSLPLIVLFATLVYIEDGGPVFYRQTRTGLFGKQFTLWKIRSMRLGSEKDGAVWSNKGDKRITNVGKVIRRFRIDELPQLVSVITGELSLVGPRPERPELEKMIEKEVPNYRVRHWIKPGLTGWAQVCYPYGASIEDSRMKLGYDIYYTRNSGILLDVLVCIKTIKLLANAEGSEAKK